MTRLISTDPATGETVWEGDAATPAQVQGAVDAARAAFPDWADRPRAERIDAVKRYQTVLKDRAETIAETRSAAKAARAAARALSAKEGEEYWAEVARKKLENGLSGEIDWKKVILIAGGVIVVTTTTVVVVKYAPAIKRGWTAKVSPALVAMKDRMTGKPAEES